MKIYGRSRTTKNQKATQADNAAKEEDLGSAESQLEVSQVEAQAKLDTLQAENEQLKVQAAEYLDSLQRERASFANYRKRIDQEICRSMTWPWEI